MRRVLTLTRRGALWSLQSAVRRQLFGVAAVLGRGGLQSSGSRDEGGSLTVVGTEQVRRDARTQTHTPTVFFWGGGGGL